MSHESWQESALSFLIVTSISVALVIALVVWYWL